MPTHLPQGLSGHGQLSKLRKSHAPRGTAASVNADARGSATIFGTQVSRGSQGTRGAVFLCALRPHMPIKMNAGVQHAGGSKKPQDDKARRDLRDAVLGIGLRVGCLHLVRLC